MNTRNLEQVFVTLWIQVEGLGIIWQVSARFAGIAS